MAGLTWASAADWDAAQSEDGAVHESTTDTDHTDATIVKQGYPVASPVPSAASLELYWPGHEDAGTTVNDLSGNSRDGTASGATPGTTGLLGTTAWDHDGTDDVVSYTAAQVLAGSNDHTILVWVKFDATGRQQIFRSHPASFQDISIEFDQGGNQKILYQLAHDTPSNATSDIYSTTTISTGTWYLIGARYDDGTGVHRLFINGVDEANASFDFPHKIDQVYVGENQGGALDMDGKWAELRVYSAVLSRATPNEFSDHYDVVRTAGNLTTAAKTVT